jgi:hypothetical protein
MASALSLATKSPASRRRRTSARSKGKGGTSALAKAQGQIARMKNAATKADGKASAVMTTVMDTAIVAGGSYASAYAAVKLPENMKVVGGIDSRLLFGGAAVVFGMSASLAGKKESYVHTASAKLGTGILAGVAYEMGHNMAIGGAAGGGAKTATFGRDVYVSGLSGR